MVLLSHVNGANDANRDLRLLRVLLFTKEKQRNVDSMTIFQYKHVFSACLRVKGSFVHPQQQLTEQSLQ